MTTKTHHASSDAVTSRGTVKGHHAKPGTRWRRRGGAVADGGRAWEAKGSASKAEAEGAVVGEDTNTATQGKLDKEHAREAGAGKTQSGRGHRKHEG